jgi:hypothetical protein
MLVKFGKEEPHMMLFSSYAFLKKKMKGILYLQVSMKYFTPNF